MMIDAMQQLDKTIDILLPEKVERPKVVEPPLGHMSRIHELMGSPEKREELRYAWQLSEDEMGQMGTVFGEIAILHDLQDPADINDVIAKRELGMRDEIYKALFKVIHQVKQRHSSNRLDPMPPDNGGNFYEDVGAFTKILDAQYIQTLPSEKFIEMMREGLRNTYAAQEMKAIGSVRTEVVEKVGVELNLNKAWRVVRDAYDMTNWKSEQEVELRRALLLIGEQKRPDWSKREIDEHVELNVRAIKSGGVDSKKIDPIGQKHIMIGRELTKIPDSTERTLVICTNIIDSYLTRNEIALDPEERKLIDTKLARLFESEMFQPIKAGTIHVDGGIFQPVFEKAVEKEISRIDDIVAKSVKATELRNRLVPYINDPPNRREAMLEWQKYVNGLLRDRLKEVRLAPITEALITHVRNGGTIDTLAADMPETNQCLMRLFDMATEAGLNLDDSDNKSIIGIVEWLQQI